LLLYVFIHDVIEVKVKNKLIIYLLFAQVEGVQVLLLFFQLWVAEVYLGLNLVDYFYLVSQVLYLGLEIVAELKLAVTI
jgi:hypothetical protein